MFRVGIPLDFVRLTTRAPHGVHSTCGEPNEIELAAAHALLYRYLATLQAIIITLVPLLTSV